MRAHKGIGSDQVFAAALKVAAERKDKAGLARLTNVLIALKRADLVAEASGAKQLADASRAVDPALIVSVEATSPEAFMLLKDTLEAIGSAKIGQNAKGLDAIAKEVPKMTELTESQRRALLRLAKEAQCNCPRMRRKSIRLRRHSTSSQANHAGPEAAVRVLAGAALRAGGGGSGRPGGGGNPGRSPRGNPPRATVPTPEHIGNANSPHAITATSTGTATMDAITSLTMAAAVTPSSTTTTSQTARAQHKDEPEA